MHTYCDVVKAAAHTHLPTFIFKRRATKAEQRLFQELVDKPLSKCILILQTDKKKILQVQNTDCYVKAVDSNNPVIIMS